MKVNGIGIIVLAMGAANTWAAPLPRVLFVTHSGGFRHQVVTRSPDGSLAFAERQLQAAARDRFEVIATQDPGELSRDKLKSYRAVVFYTTGELPIEVEALTDFVRDGGGFAGIHSATDTLYKSAAYGDMIGGYFDGHPWHEKVRIEVEDTRHPATAHLGPSFEIADEIYQFKDWDRKKLHVLLSLDDASVDLAKQGVKRADHDFANAWTREYGEGRVFYTALGHREEVWADPRFLTHLVNGIAWALRAAPPARPAAATSEEGFTWLLQAAAPPPAWKQAGYKIDNGVATANGGKGLWYLEGPRLNDFVLRLEYRQAKPSAQPAPELSQKAPGEWNEMEITAAGQEYTVRLNGKVINTYTGSRALEGMIGLQNHHDEVSFRNVRVKELR